MTRPVRSVALAAVAVLAFSACASNDAKRSDVVNAMLDAGLDQEQADCIGDGIDEAFGDDQDLYNDVAAAVDTDEFPEGTEDQINAVLDDCLGEGSGTDGDGDDDGTSDTTEGDDATTESTESGG